MPGIFCAKKKVKTNVKEWFSDGLGGYGKCGAYSVSECVEKAWWERNKDTDIRRYVALDDRA